MKRVARFVRAHPLGSGLGAVAVIGALSFGIYWFGPQYLFIDRTVDEALPTAVAPDAGTEEGVATDKPAADDPASDEPTGDGQGETTGPAESAEPQELARGSFRGIAHEGSGTAIALDVPGRGRFVRFEDFEVFNGPDLRVYLSAAKASAPESAFDDDFFDLGALKGNVGNQNYQVPGKVDLSDYRSVVVWCRRFSVGFASAPLETA